MAQILNEYAKALFYGRFTNSEPELQKAFYFFKLASSYGNSESLYYLSFYSAYHLDGRYLLLKNYENLSKEDQHVYLKNYIKNMNATTLLTNTYISSMQGYNTSTFLMGVMYWDVRIIHISFPYLIPYKG
jgi:TPR repeat protein